MSDPNDTTVPTDAELADMHPLRDAWPGSCLRVAIKLVLKLFRSVPEGPRAGSPEAADEMEERLYLTGVEGWEEWVAAWRRIDPPPSLLGFLTDRIREALAQFENEERIDPAGLRGRSGRRYQ